VLPLRERIASTIRERGPISVAEFMELALYDPQYGYYTRSGRRSGKTGDFYTSVDVSPLFGELIAEQLAEMWPLVRAADDEGFDFVEAGAADGRLTRDILDALASRHPDLYRRTRVTLVERSAAARNAQVETLAHHAERLIASESAIPHAIKGAIVANELLDAIPAHVLEMTGEGVREVMVAEQDEVLIEITRAVSDPGLLADVPALGSGERFESSPARDAWIRGAADSLTRGFLLLFDYAYEPTPQHLERQPRGTLMSYRAHVASEDWLRDPGERDLTVHVNLAAVRRAASDAGLTTLGIVDQTYFLLGLGLADRLDPGSDARAVGRRVAARTLIMPGGLGDTMKAMLFSKGVHTATLRGIHSGRLT